MNVHILSATPLFQGIKDREIESVLKCLSAEEKSFQKDAYIYRAGDITGRLGVVMEGSVNIIKDDVWGNRKIIENISQGQIFAETYACLKGEALMVDVQASEPAKVLFMDVNRILTTCPSACTHHNRLIQNLLYISSQKNLNLSRRIFHTSSKSIRGRLLSYLSFQASKAGSRDFCIPFNRQQLADYLSIDRSAMSAELGKMRKEGILETDKNHFVLKTDLL